MFSFRKLWATQADSKLTLLERILKEVEHIGVQYVDSVSWYQLPSGQKQTRWDEMQWRTPEWNFREVMGKVSIPMAYLVDNRFLEQQWVLLKEYSPSKHANVSLWRKQNRSTTAVYVSIEEKLQAGRHPVLPFVSREAKSYTSFSIVGYQKPKEEK